MVLDESEIALELDILGPLLLTVLLSVFLHGGTMHTCINISFDEPSCAGAVAVEPLPPGHVLLDLPVAQKKILHSRGQQHHYPYHRSFFMHYGKRHGQKELGQEEDAIDSSDSLWQDLGIEERRYEYDDPLSDSAGLMGERDVEEEKKAKYEENTGDVSRRRV